MAHLVRANVLARLYPRIVSRGIRTSSPRKFDPVPVTRKEVGSELEALLAKEKGPWTQLSKEEKVALYKAEFNQTLAQARAGEPYGAKLAGGIAIGIAVSVLFFTFLRKYIGPEPPSTLTPQWREDSIKKMKRQHANPITGVGSQA